MEENLTTHSKGRWELSSKNILALMRFLLLRYSVAEEPGNKIMKEITSWVIQRVRGGLLIQAKHQEGR